MTRLDFLKEALEIYPDAAIWTIRELYLSSYPNALTLEGCKNYFLEENDISYWVEDKSKPWLTPDGDTVWVCQACGGGQHVYGGKSNSKMIKCPDCGAKMFYKYDIPERKA